MSGIPVAADKRFRRAHVAPTRRAGLSRFAVARHVVAALLATLALYEVVSTIVRTNMLAVRYVSVDGNERMSTGAILGVLDDIRGAGILTVDLEACRARLKRSPWIAEARVHRVLPSTIRVEVEERDPIGVGRIGDQLFLVDETGTIIDEFGPGHASLDLPVIDGLTAGPRDAATLVDPARAALAARLLRSLKSVPQISRRVSQIDVADVRDAAVILDGDPAILRLGHERFAERVQLYVDAAERLRESVVDIDSVDLRFGRNVYVRPRPGRARETLAQGAPATRRARPAGE
jgi:cell division septal protein FtsQ